MKMYSSAFKWSQISFMRTITALFDARMFLRCVPTVCGWVKEKSHLLDLQKGQEKETEEPQNKDKVESKVNWVRRASTDACPGRGKALPAWFWKACNIWHKFRELENLNCPIYPQKIKLALRHGRAYFFRPFSVQVVIWYHSLVSGTAT